MNLPGQFSKNVHCIPRKYDRSVKVLLFIFAFYSLPFFSYCQPVPFEVRGTFQGAVTGKIYLFFEGDYRHRDSISSEIINGKFHFTGNVKLPVQARLHLDQRSFICDLFLDSRLTHISCSNKMTISQPGNDSLNMLEIVSVHNSATEQLKRNFEKGVSQIQQKNLSAEAGREMYVQLLRAFIRQHPSNKVSPYLLGKANSLYFTQVSELSKEIDSTLRGSFEMRSVYHLLNQLDKSGNSLAGVTFRDFTLQDSSGKQFSTLKYHSKYTLVVFWASWCGPCRAEHPELKKLYAQYHDRGFEILGISLDTDPAKWKQALIKDQLNWPQMADPAAFEGEMSRYYGIEAIPASYLLDQEGKIIGTGYIPAQLEQILGKYF